MTEAERKYYLNVADYAGIVTQTKFETVGLTPEHYRDWYIMRSLAFYRVTEANARWNGKLMRLGIKNRNGHKMLQRRLGRLYLKRKINNIREGLDLSCQLERRGLNNVYEGGKRVATDHTLFLATELKRVAILLSTESSILLEARLASVFNRPSNELNPDFDYQQNELFTGKRIALIEYFHRLLTEFDSDVLQLDSKSGIANAIDSILIGYTEQGLTKILVSVGLLVDAQTRAHTQDSKPRTWRAVVEALRNRKYLEAGGDAVALWKALNETYGPAPGQLPSKRNLQDPMLDHNAHATLVYKRAYGLLPPKV